MLHQPSPLNGIDGHPVMRGNGTGIRLLPFGGVNAWCNRPIFKNPPSSAFAFIFISLFVFVVIKSAWVSDDAYITFRTVSNFIHGYGLTWNTSERVQAFTNPLWMLVMSACFFFTRDVYYTSIILSLLLSVLTVWVLAFKIAVPPGAPLLSIALLTSSKAFIDYSTYGLESPLTHFLLVIFCSRFFSRDADLRELTYLCFITSLATVNRLDTFLIFFPPLAFFFWKCVKRNESWSAAGLTTSIIAGFSPLVLWEIFAIVYYGFPFPNTAYAKLFSVTDHQQELTQGFYYLLESFEHDPITVTVTMIGTALPLFRRDYKGTAIAVGVLFYLIYVVTIGGDFMSGRFLAAPFLGAVVLVSRCRITGICFEVLLIVIVVAGLVSPGSPLLVGSNYKYQGFSATGVADERGFYYQDTGLLREHHFFDAPAGHKDGKHLRALSGREQVVCIREAIGRVGYSAGPHVFIIDPMGLTDAFLARIPIAPIPGNVAKWRWRIGHAYRVVPEGYEDTVRFNRTLIKDKRYAEFYDKLSLITRGQLFNWSRFVEIWNMNVGKNDHLLRKGRAS